MRAPDLLAELHRRGVEIRAAGDRIRYRPASKVPLELREEIRAHGSELLAELAPAQHDDPLGIEDQEPKELRVEPTAYLLYSRLLEREVWLCRDDQAAGEIAAEFPGVPVLTFAEVPLLQGKPVELLRAIVATKACFPGARVEA